MGEALHMIDHARALFPFNRSLTGSGTINTLLYFESIHPEFERLRFLSGQKIEDWIIPKVWEVNKAYIQHIRSGKIFADFQKSNLHLVGYSIPFKGVLSLTELSKHIYTLPKQPNWTPYVTSYYTPSWGFCLPHSSFLELPEGDYNVIVDTTLEDGYLEMSHINLSGFSSKEIFFSSYVCHPSMANNEISGPVLLNEIFQYIKSQYSSSQFSYRGVLLPETIGSIAYLSMFGDSMINNMLSGFNLSCVGDERAYSFVHTPYADTITDKALSAAFIGLNNVIEYSYLQRGSDERQYCSPRYRLPVCSFSRSKYGEYPEYHTSADDFSVVTRVGLDGAFNVLKSIIDAFETCLFPFVSVKGEPQLGRRGLYPNTSIKRGLKHPAQDRMDILSYCDGRNSVFDISLITNIPLSVVTSEIRLLLANDLIVDTYQYS